MKLLPILLAAVFMLEPSSAGEKPGDAVISKLENIRLPKVAFDQIPANEAVDFISQRVVELDHDPDPAKKGVSFLLIGAAGHPKITFSAKDITVMSLLRQIGKQAQVDIQLTSAGILICPAGQPPFPNPKAKTVEIWQTIYSVPDKAAPSE